MINYEAFFKISYGLYIVSSGDRDKSNAFISNTVFQVTAEPPQFAASCNKNNHTAGLIEATGVFSVSVLHQETAPILIGNLGYKSGRDSSKMEGLDIIYGETGVPIVLNDSIAWLECKVVQTFDVGTHLVFIGEVVNSELLNEDKEQITYDYYRKTRKALSPKNAPTYVDKSKLKKAEPPKQTAKKYLCPACGYIYDPEKGDPESGIPPGTKFEDLPDSWVCPVCGTEKIDFVEQ